MRRWLCADSWQQRATHGIRCSSRRAPTSSCRSLSSRATTPRIYTQPSTSNCLVSSGSIATLHQRRSHAREPTAGPLALTAAGVQRRFTTSASTSVSPADSSAETYSTSATGVESNKESAKPRNARNTMGDTIPNEEVFFNSSDVKENDAYVKNHIDQYISITEVSTMDGVRWLDVEGRPERWKSGTFSREGSFAIAVIKALEKINVAPEVLQLVARRVTLPELHVNEESRHALLVLRTAKLNRKWPRISMRVRDEEYNVASLLSEIKTADYVRRKRRLRMKLREKKMEAERREAAHRFLNSLKTAMKGTGIPIHGNAVDTKNGEASGGASTDVKKGAETNGAAGEEAAAAADASEVAPAKKEPPVRGINHDPETCPVCLAQRKDLEPKLYTVATEKEFRAEKRLEELQGKAERLLAEEERQRLRKLAARYAIRNAHRERHSHLFGGPLAAVRRMTEGNRGGATVPEEPEFDEDLDDEDVVAEETDSANQAPQTLDNITERLNIFVVREPDERFDALDEDDDDDETGMLKEVPNIGPAALNTPSSSSDLRDSSLSRVGDESSGNTGAKGLTGEENADHERIECDTVVEESEAVSQRGNEASKGMISRQKSSPWANAAVMAAAATTAYPSSYSSLTAFHAPDIDVRKTSSKVRDREETHDGDAVSLVKEHSGDEQPPQDSGAADPAAATESNKQEGQEKIPCAKKDSAKKRKLRLLKHKIINAVEAQYGKEAAQMFKGPSKAAVRKKKQKLRAEKNKKKVFGSTEEIVEEIPIVSGAQDESTTATAAGVLPASGIDSSNLSSSSPSASTVREAKPKRWRWCIITVHRSHMPFLDDMLFTWNHSQSVYKQSGSRLLFYQVHGVVQSIQQANTEHLRRLDELEMVLFQLPAQDRGFTNVLAQVHSISRCANVHAKQLRELQRCLQNIHEHVSLDLSKSERFLEEQYIRSAISLSDELSEQARSLLFLQFSVGVNTMENHLRMLTVFSAVFVPIDFLSAWFGTNFIGIHEFCESPNTILACVAMMIATVMITVRWMRRNISVPARA